MGRYLQLRGYDVVPVNPGHAGGRILGAEVHARLSDIPGPVDMVDIFRRSEEVPEIVDEALEVLERSQRHLPDHPIVLHTYPGQKDLKYDPMLDAGKLDGASLQVSSPPNVHAEVLEWRTKSKDAGMRWVVSLDEQGSAGNGVGAPASAGEAGVETP